MGGWINLKIRLTSSQSGVEMDVETKLEKNSGRAKEREKTSRGLPGPSLAQAGTGLN